MALKSVASVNAVLHKANVKNSYQLNNNSKQKQPAESKIRPTDNRIIYTEFENNQSSLRDTQIQRLLHMRALLIVKFKKTTFTNDELKHVFSNFDHLQKSS